MTQKKRPNPRLRECTKLFQERGYTQKSDQRQPDITIFEKRLNTEGPCADDSAMLALRVRIPPRRKEPGVTHASFSYEADGIYHSMRLETLIGIVNGKHLRYYTVIDGDGSTSLGVWAGIKPIDRAQGDDDSISIEKIADYEEKAGRLAMVLGMVRRDTELAALLDDVGNARVALGILDRTTATAQLNRLAGKMDMGIDPKIDSWHDGIETARTELEAIDNIVTRKLSEAIDSMLRILNVAVAKALEYLKSQTPIIEVINATVADYEAK